MSIFKTSYDTTIGKLENTKNIASKIEEAFIRDMIYEKNLNYDISPNYKLCFIDGSDTSEEAIPQIVHPLLITHTTNKGNNSYLCTDIRLFVNPRQFEADNIRPKVKNFGEFNIAVDKALLTLMWLDENIDIMKNDMNFAGNVYATWITDLISKRFALGGRDQLCLTVLAYLYYQSLFTINPKITDEDKEVAYIKLVSQLKIPKEIIEYVFNKGEMFFTNINSFCEIVKDTLENVRLKDFNVGILATLVGMSWFGVNAGKILTVALEHPPTWIAMVGNIYSYKGYKNTNICKTIEKVNKKGYGEEFISSYRNLLKFKDQGV